MNQERWHEILELISSQFKVLEKKKEPYGKGREIRGEKESVIFTGHPLGRIKLEFIKRPKVLEKKIYSHRRKAGAEIEYVLSSEEFVYQLLAFRWDPETGEWVEMEPAGFGGK